MTNYYKDNLDLYYGKKFSIVEFSKSILNNNALINGAGLICGVLSVLVVL